LGMETWSKHKGTDCPTVWRRWMITETNRWDAQPVIEPGRRHQSNDTAAKPNIHPDIADIVPVCSYVVKLWCGDISTIRIRASVAMFQDRSVLIG
jgi:hypothetical protein